MEARPASITADPAQIILIQRKLTYEAGLRSGVNWFYGIAGLSLINSFIYLAGGSLTFVVGLGATQFVDGFMSALAKDLGAGIFPRLIGFILDLVIGAVFVGAGYLGRKRHRWAVVTGMGLYALDALVFVWFGEWLAVAFHAFALWGLWRGLQAINGLMLLEKEGPILVPAIPVVQQSSARIGSPKTFRIFVLVVVGLAVCMLLFLLTALFLPQLLR